MRPSIVIVIGVLILVGCSSVPPAFPPSSLSPSRLSTRAVSGRSPELAPGHPLGFWIWQESDGLWHVRTTAKRKDHRFQGVVRPLEGGEIVDLRLVSIDSKDRVGMVGRALSFDFRTRSAMDGFNFRLRGSACLEFDLRLDDDGTPRYVYLGQDKIAPDSSHFILCP